MLAPPNDPQAEEFAYGLLVDEAEALREFCKGRIAHFKTPRHIKFVDDFPMTISGKVQKFRMREISVVELGISEQH